MRRRWREEPEEGYRGFDTPFHMAGSSMTKTVLGIIGGSGVYDISDLENARWQRVDSPWGKPSDDLLLGTLMGVDLAFLPRHGRGHVH